MAGLTTTGVPPAPGVTVGVAGVELCCPDDRYCYLNTEWEAQCCPRGTSCPDSPCAETEYYCNKTIQAEGGGGLTQKTDCCKRQCDDATQFRCPDELGGGCCDVGDDCTISEGENACRVNTPSSPPETGGDTAKKLKIGLSVGLVALVGGLGGICFYQWRRRRRAQRRRVDRSAEGWPGKPELPGDGAVPPRHELPEDTLHELPGEGATPELPEALEGRPHELPGSSVPGQPRGNG